MQTSPPNEITPLLLRWSQGDSAALTQLLPVVYEELRKLAQSYLRRERPDHTLQPTALINEAYLRLVKQDFPEWQSRRHFFGVAAQLMRQVLVEHARARAAGKRGGGQKFSLEEALTFSDERAAELLALDDALVALAKFDERKVRIIELRYFGGLSLEEEALRRLGDRQGALQNLRQALQIWQELLSRDGANQRTRADLHDTMLALAATMLEAGDHSGALEYYRQALRLAETPPVEQSADLYVRWRLADSCAGLSSFHAARAAVAPPAERLDHWREARQYAQASLGLWEGWSRHAASTSFDRRQREQAARAVAACDAALAKLGAAAARQ